MSPGRRSGLRNLSLAGCGVFFAILQGANIRFSEREEVEEVEEVEKVEKVEKVEEVEEVEEVEKRWVVGGV